MSTSRTITAGLIQAARLTSQTTTTGNIGTGEATADNDVVCNSMTVRGP